MHIARNNRKKLLIILLAIIVTLLVAGGVAFAFYLKNNQSQNDTNGSTSSKSEKDKTPQHEGKQATEEEVNEAHTGHEEEKGSDEPFVPETTFGDLTTDSKNGSLTYKVKVNNATSGGECELLLLNTGGARPTADKTKVQSDTCTQTFSNAALTSGSGWTVTVTYTDSKYRITTKRAIVIN